jgi:carboxyl-terminal processing protease
MSRPLVVAGALCCAGCITSVRPLSDDFSDETPARALGLTLDRLEQAYSFTAWKRRDWPEVRSRLGARMDAASGRAAQDAVWRDLLLELPDGHAALWNDEPTRDPCPEADGTLGVVFAEVEDGGLVVVEAQAGTGPRAGDRLVSLGGLFPEDALDAAPLRCSPLGLATHARRRAVRVRLLGRAPVGAAVGLELERDGAAVSLLLDALEDGPDIAAGLGLSPAEDRVSWEMVRPGVGYLALGWEETFFSEEGLRRGLRALHADGARALVLDLRDNDGGTDQTAANIAGSFTDRPWFYETITMYDRRSEGQVEISEVWVEPQELRWDLPVAVLINGNTVSSGEGLAMMLARFPGVDVVGFEGTAASFGSAGSTTQVPGGWALSWPAGRSLDADGRIQLDSDDSLTGGVQPTVRVPWTAENRIADAERPVYFLVDWAIEHVLEAP